MSRFGVSYQTPTWYTELLEDTNITDNSDPLDNGVYQGETEISISSDPQNPYSNLLGRFAPRQSLFYKLRTPAKVTVSSAFVFGKVGLISLDYSTQNFQSLNLSGDNFINENQRIRK